MCPVLTDEIAPYRRRLIGETVRNPLLELAMSGLLAVSVLAKVDWLLRAGSQAPKDKPAAVMIAVTVHCGGQTAVA